MRTSPTPHGDQKATDAPVEWNLLALCKCGYRYEGMHRGDVAELTYHPFFCTKCSAVKAQLGLRKSTPVCPTCQTPNVLSYGEEALTRPAQPGTQTASGVNASIAHFCPQCRNPSLFFRACE